MSGGGGDSSAPASTTSNSTNTVIQDVPAWEQQYLTSLLGQATTAAAQPYQQFPGQQVAGFTPDQTQAFSNVENLINGGSAATAGTAANNSAAAGANTASSIYGAGAGDINAATNYNPLAAASPFLSASANAGTPQGISAYMSPYTNSVVQGLVNTANQNWNQNIMPGVDNEFVSAGQSGSGRNAQVLGQAANNEQTNLNSAVANTLQSGYNQASTNAANQASTLGNLANTAASATNSQAQNLQSAGTNLGNLASTQAGAQGNAAANLANTANTVQNTGITGASALQAVGQQQQTQNQTNLNTAQTNFQNQVQYPEQQLGFLSDIIRGLPTTTSSTSVAQSPTTTNQIGSTSPLSTLGGTILGASGISGSKKGGLIKGYAEGGSVDPAAQYRQDNGMDTPPIDDQRASMGLPVGSAIMADNNASPLSYANDNSTNSPLRTVDSDSTQSRNLQLLSMARGLLTPSHSGAESLGNGIGGYLKTSMEMPVYQGEQQDVVSKQLGNAQTYAGLVRQNMINQANGLPTLPLPNIPGLSGYGQQIQKSLDQAPMAATTSNGQIMPISASPSQPQTTSSPSQTQSGGMNLMQALSIANGNTPASEDQKYQAVVKLQASQFPIPAAMVEEAKQYAQDKGKLANAGAIKGAETYAQQSAEMPFVGTRAAAEAKAKAMYPETITARQNETTYAPTAGIQVNGAQSGVGTGGAGYMTNPSIGPIQNTQTDNSPQVQAEPAATIAGKITQAVSAPSGQGSYGTPQSSRLTSVPKDVTDWIKEYPTQRDALAQQMSSITTINNSINGLSGDGLVGMGAGAEGRRDFANAVNTAQKIAGVSDPNLMYDPTKIASADEFTKSSLALAQARAKQLGARVTNFEMSSAQKQNPSLSMPELSARLLTNINGEGVQREIDRQDFIQNSIKSGISPSDAAKNFEQIASPDLYVKRAQSQIAPIKVSSSSDLGSLMPGTKVMDPKGRIGYVPIPANYPLHVMPINPLYKGQ